MKSILIGFFLALATSFATLAAPLDTWHCRNPLPQGNPLYDVKFINGIWVAVGEFGTILTSTDSTNWTRAESGTTMNLNGSAFGAGVFVVVGNYGTVLTSTDGIEWTTHYAGTFYSLKAVIFADNQFIAVGENSTILTSPDGVVWTQSSSGDWTLFDIIQAHGIYVAVGAGVILTSSDAQTWTVRLLTVGSTASTVAFGNEQFAAYIGGGSGPYGGYYRGGIYTSVDGTNWQAANYPTPYSPSAIFFEQGHWVSSAGYDDPAYVLLASTDLIQWSAAATNGTSINGMASGNGLTVACDADGTFLSSTDAFNWPNPAPDLLSSYPVNLAFVNGKFAWVGYNQIAYSSDGMVWTNLVTLTNTAALVSITYGRGLYVAGAQSRNIWASPDGVNWTNPAPQLSLGNYDANVSVAFGNGVFVGAAGYEGDILTSSDGLNWNVQQLNTNASDYVYFSDVKFANGRFVAVGESTVATSTDGTNWCTQSTNLDVSAVAGGNGFFVAVGYLGAFRSTDATNWTPVLSAPLTDVAFGNGCFVAVGDGVQYPDYSTESPVWVSTDGISWSLKHSQTPLTLNNVAFGDGTFVIGGQNDLLLQSDPLVNVTLNAGSTPSLSIAGPVSRSYRIDYVGSLRPPLQWQPLTTLPPSTNPATFYDETGTKRPARFYRAVLLP